MWRGESERWKKYSDLAVKVEVPECRNSQLQGEMAKVHTSFTQVQILVFKNTLVKVEVLTKLLYSCSK